MFSLFIPYVIENSAERFATGITIHDLTCALSGCNLADPCTVICKSYCMLDGMRGAAIVLGIVKTVPE